MSKLQLKLKTTLGNLYLVASEVGLQKVTFAQNDGVVFVNAANETNSIGQILARAARQIQEYFQGTRKEFEVKLDWNGTPFQVGVWEQLLKLPYGTTASYKQIAKSIKNEKAMRAVGTANGRNPLSIIIPCHRVIAADGSIGGYAGGINIKQKLLEIERRYS